MLISIFNETKKIIRPSNKGNLEKVEDFPTEKIETIGLRFIECITSFCKKYQLTMDNFDKKPVQATPKQTKLVRPEI